MAFFPIKNKILLLTPLQYFLKVFKALVERISVDGKSSMNTSTTFSTISLSIPIMHLEKVPGAFHKPNGMRR